MFTKDTFQPEINTAQPQASPQQQVNLEQLSSAQRDQLFKEYARQQQQEEFALVEPARTSRGGALGKRKGTRIFS